MMLPMVWEMPTPAPRLAAVSDIGSQPAVHVARKTSAAVVLAPLQQDRNVRILCSPVKPGLPEAVSLLRRSKPRPGMVGAESNIRHVLHLDRWQMATAARSSMGARTGLICGPLKSQYHCSGNRLAGPVFPTTKTQK